MGEIKKIGDVYYIEFIARGLKYSQIAGATEEQAGILLRSIEAKISAGEALSTVRDIDIVIFIEDFLSSTQAQESTRTYHRFKTLTTHFLGFLRETYPHISKLSQITPKIIESYKFFLKKSFSCKKINFSLLLLRDVLDYGISIGFINDNPTLHVALLPWPAKKIVKSEKYLKIQELIAQGVSFVKIGRLMQISDIARLLHFSNLIPLSREDIL